MLTELLWGMIVGILSGILSLIPPWNLNTEALDTTSFQVGGFVAMANGYFPVNTLVICIGILIAAKVILFAFRILQWVYGVIPFKMT